MKNVTQAYTNRWRSLLFICISLLVISLDNTIVNVALPSISNQFGGVASDLQWIVDAYILVFAALLLTMGSLGDRFGRKRVLQLGLVWFSIGSLVAALSQSTLMLIASRAFLGVGGAMIMPSTLSLISATFLNPKERFQAIAIWGAVFGLGGGLGPVVGGLLLQLFGWNAVFLVNLPVIALALIGGSICITESKDTAVRPIDIPGVLLSVVGLFALVYGIIEAGITSWTDLHVLLAFGVAAVLLGIFALWESRAPNAMLPAVFFKNRSFSAANAALVLVMFAMYGSIFFLSQYLQSVQGYSALAAGVRLLPMALVVTVGAALSARISGRLGIKATVGGGILLAAVGLFLLSRVATVDAPYTSIVLALVIFSAGLGLAMPPATASVMGSVPVNKAGVGSAMNDTTRQLGGALGVAVLGTIMNNVYINQLATLKDTSRLATVPAQAFEAISSSVQGAHVIAHHIGASPIAQTITDTANQAFVSGMTEAMLVGAVILGVASVLTFAILPAQVRHPEENTTTPEVIVNLPEVGQKSEVVAP